MQLSDITQSFPLPPRTANAPEVAIAHRPAPAAENPEPPMPSAQVILGSVRAANIVPDVYDKPVTVITATYLRDQETPAEHIASAGVAKILSSHLQALNEKKVPFSAGLFFSQAGALSRETSSYSNEARSRNIAADIAAEKMRPDFTQSAGKVTSAATLNIRTRDGDTISITLAHKSETRQLNFSFHVEGELSAEEQLALEKLAAKLGEVADEFFRSGTAELRGLDEFANDTLDSFSLSLSKFNGKDYDTFSYDYSIDETGTARLSGKDIFGYEFDIKTHLNGLLTEGQAAAYQSLEKYIELIRKAGDDQDAPSSSVRFMLDGLRSMLIDKTKNPTAPEAMPSQLLQNFATGLPDFTATFTSAVKHNPSHYKHVSSMNLSMGQATRIETQNSRTLIQQKSFYELNRSHWEAPPGLDRADLDHGNYNYVNEFIRESISRTMDINQSRATDIFIETDLKWQRKEQAFIDFEGQEIHKSEDSRHHLVNLIDELSPHANEKTNQHNLLQLLNQSRADFFTGW